MNAVAEKKHRSASTVRTVMRATLAWSRAPTPEHTAMRAIVAAPRAHANSQTPALAAKSIANLSCEPTQNSAVIFRECAECADELQHAPATESMQRAIEVGAADDDNEREADTVATAV